MSKNFSHSSPFQRVFVIVVVLSDCDNFDDDAFDEMRFMFLCRFLSLSLFIRSVVFIPFFENGQYLSLAMGKGQSDGQTESRAREYALEESGEGGGEKCREGETVKLC